MFTDKVVYALNGAAIGDLIAAAPALKWSIETFHHKTDYKVAMFPEFRELFPFVPDDKIIPIQAQYEPGYAVRILNVMKGGGPNFCRPTPARFKLTHYACINLLSRILPDDQLKYVPLKKVDVSKFNIDFSKCVVIATTYRDIARSIMPDELLKIAQYVQSKGLTPLYIGKTGGISIWKTLAVSDFEYPGFGIDLRDKTTLSESATIMSMCKAVVGMDSGSIHLAFTTDTPVVCGFTNVRPDLRIPYRGLAKTYAVTPEIPCNFCQSDWALDFWDFSKCPRQLKLPECAKKMTATKFIAGLEQLGIFKDA
jgi:hypothetical protein